MNERFPYHIITYHMICYGAVIWSTCKPQHTTRVTRKHGVIKWSVGNTIKTIVRL